MKKIARQDHARLADALEASARTPTAEELAVAPVLDAWIAAEELNRPVLIGTPENHPSLADSDLIRTSAVMRFDPIAGYARTQSRWYRLGKPMREVAPETADRIAKGEGIFLQLLDTAEFQAAIAKEVDGVSEFLATVSLDA